ncbi:MAG: ABC transporter ATP-binding protein [Chloroflexota bacterium]
MATIELVNVAHQYVPGQYAVRDINLKWENGVSSALLGPSGCGKTTLLKIISGLLKPTEGDVLLDGKRVNELSAKERNIAQVFQFPVVYETLSVFDNLAFPLRNRGVARDLVKKRVHEIAELLELTNVLKKNAASLGSGEKQLISLGRGVVRENMAAVLLDEPLTVIDIHQKWHIRRKLKQLQRQLNLTMIYVTHDQHEALTFADQVTVMDTGIALQTGGPHDLHERPQAPFVGYFIGSPGMNIFPASYRDGTIHAWGIAINMPQSGELSAADSNIKVGIRPEFINVSQSDQAGHFETEVSAVHLTGTAKILDLSGSGLSFKARVADTAQIKAGQTVWAQFPAASTIVYKDDRAVNLGTQEVTV